METEQEQIEKMARTMCGYCSTDGKCAVSKNGREPDICANVDTQHCLYKEYAERLIENGRYGDVSEYKAEIERLRTTLGQCNVELNSALESLKSQCREIGELKAKIKQTRKETAEKIISAMKTMIINRRADERSGLNSIYTTYSPERLFDDILDYVRIAMGVEVEK